MIITPERLLDLARSDVEDRAKGERVRCAFAVGSVVHGEPLLGGAADVDVVILHKRAPSREREIVRLSRDVHLDLYHHPDDDFQSPREVRLDPYLGPAIEAGVPLFDPEHFFDWLQAGVRAQFHRPDHALERAHLRLGRARTAQQELARESGQWPQKFVGAALDGANAAASLAGPPPEGRRVLLNLRRRLVRLDRPDLLERLIDLLGAQASDSWNLPQWLSGWAKAYDQAIEAGRQPTRTTVRRDYYLRGFQALADADQAQAVLVPMVMSWPDTDQKSGLVDDKVDYVWEDLLETTELQQQRVKDKAQELESYLDRVELFLESWGDEHGA